MNTTGNKLIGFRLQHGVLFVAVIMLVLVNYGYPKGKPAPDEQTGIKVGEKAPQFTLKDQNGEERSLVDFLKKGKVAIYFYRSAGWCPFCQRQLKQLQKDAKAIEETGTQIIAISYDAVETLKKFADKNEISYLLLSDVGSKTIDAYGIRNTTGKVGTPYDGIPYPGTFLLDKDGIVRAKFFVEGYSERIDNAEVLKAAKELE